MNSKSFRHRSLLTVVLVIAVVGLATGTAVASGVSSAVFGDGGSPTAGHSSAVGTLSATDCPDCVKGGGSSHTRTVGTSGGGGKLPFTGFVALFVLASGVVLLGAGLIVRRRAGRAPATG
jgi:hypothetical protein